MTADPLSIPAESLLQHRAFVQRLARSLVRDEHAAQDLVQETWLEALRHPPRSASAVRSWLARVVRTRAQNVARGDARRLSRERGVAREEADASEDRLRERVAMQHKVVEAVLGLKEPYRTVVLLHYYEGLSPAAIAARRGAPSGTVRAQLTRGHELLRERLDAEYGGVRSAWCAGLAALARGRGATLAPNLAVLGSIAAAAAVPVILWVARPAEETTLPVLASTTASLPLREAVEASSPVADPEPSPASNARSAVLAEPAPPQILPKEELEPKSVRQLLQLALQVQQVLRTKLLTPAEEWKRSCASLLALPDTGLARILHPKQFGTLESNALGLRGAGACFSLATRKQGWDDEPDVELYEGTLRIQGWGPAPLDLGDGTLEDLPSSPEAVPPGLQAKEQVSWSVHWADSGSTDRGPSDEYKRKSEVWLPNPKPVAGHVYLVRGITPGAHDLLGAIRLLAEDDTGWTFAWRVLRTWPVVRTRGDVTDPYWLAADPPESLAAVGVDALVDLLARIREVARRKLYDIPADVRSRFADFLAGEEKGVTRLLPRGRYDPLVEGRGGGAYFSFATKQLDYDHEPDISFDQGMYYSGLYGGNAGLLLDLGVVPLESIGSDAGREPPGLAEKSREAWQLLWKIAPLDEGRMNRAISREDEEAARRIELVGRAGPAVGHTYLIRSIHPGQHDVLAVFTTAARDEHGDWIAYRVIWNRKLEPDPKPR